MNAGVRDEVVEDSLFGGSEKNIPVAPESLAILLVMILLLFLDKEHKVGSVIVVS